MMEHELRNNDNNIVTVPDSTHVHLNLKSGTK